MEIKLIVQQLKKKYFCYDTNKIFTKKEHELVQTFISHWPIPVAQITAGRQHISIASSNISKHCPVFCFWANISNHPQDFGVCY